ncbi:MAG: potassium channel family protein [Proteobacteria bacterium]|nr:ion transporter [Pseudomonadota bacterium]NOG61239.1 potassium channel family protein [Pseudomonadota bacterium]
MDKIENSKLYTQLDELYNGSGKNSNIFRVVLITVDVLSILYFVVASFFHHTDDFHALEVGIGIYYLIEFNARLYISKQRLKYLLNPISLADIVVILSLLAPALTENFAFLRLIRSLRILRSYQLLKTMRKQSKFVRLHEDIIFSIVNLFVFIFIVTALVYVLQVDVNPGISNYFEALYFTVATLTTTGFGDVTLIGTSGHLLAILIMIFGITLFLRLIQTIFRPGKVRHECPSCGLIRHDADAVHCKHCGTIIHIQSEGSN